MSLKYDNTLLATTEYVEALALYFYCDFNNLNFDEEIGRRDKNELNDFPDFKLKSKNLEIVRAFDEFEGLEQKWVNAFFGRGKLIKKYDELTDYTKEYNKKYGQKYGHHLKIKVTDDNVWGALDLKDYQSIITTIKKTIDNKYGEYNKKNNERKLDLFVINYHCLDKKSIQNLFDLYSKNNELNSFFDDVYISYLCDEDTKNNYVMRMNKEEYEVKIVHSPDKNQLLDKIIRLGRINGNQGYKQGKIFKKYEKKSCDGKNDELNSFFE